MRSSHAFLRHGALALAAGLMLPVALAATSDGPPARYPQPASSPAQESASKSSNTGKWVAGAVALVAGAAAVKEINAAKKQNQALKSENDALRKSNDELAARAAELGRANAEFKQRLDSSAHGMAQERAALEQAKLDLERSAGELQTARRQLADIREVDRQAIDALKAQLAGAGQREAQLKAALADARGERPLWAALAAVLAAGLAAAGVRHWWPRRIAKPCAVSVSPGAWSASAHGLGAEAAFRVQACWLPGDSVIHAPSGLVRQADVVSIHGEAA